MTSTYSPGLEGVTAGISAISDVDAEQNKLIYRGYDIHDLVEHCDFDEVAYLLIYGKLPNEAEFASFMTEVGANRQVQPFIYDIFAALPKDTHPMDSLKAAIAAMAPFDPDYQSNTTAANRAKALRLYAKIPTLVVNGHLISQGRSPVEPNSSLSHNTNFFEMMTGQPRTDLFADAFNVIQILYAEHGFNASTFTARVTVSTLSDLYSGVVSAIGALKGNLHGGANEAAIEALLEIGHPSEAERWLKQALAEKRKIMGFGHREYKHGDERAKIAKQYEIRIGERVGDKILVPLAQKVEDLMLESKKLYPNLDFPVSVAYYLMKLPIPLYTPLFVMSRICGWSAHIIEQLDHNRIIRPHSEYNGPKNQKVVPIEKRV